MLCAVIFHIAGKHLGKNIRVRLSARQHTATHAIGFSSSLVPSDREFWIWCSSNQPNVRIFLQNYYASPYVYTLSHSCYKSGILQNTTFSCLFSNLFLVCCKRALCCLLKTKFLKNWPKSSKTYQ